ncbi:MAG: glycosyltransferase family 4 protein [Fusobacteriaceae bacterium]
MKIMFVANKLWDVYIFRGRIIKKLVEDGHEIVVIAPDDKRIDVEKELGVKVIDIAVDKRGINPIKDLKLMISLLKIYIKEKPDLIFHYTIKLNIYGTLSARILNKKNIAIITGLGYSFVNKGIISKLAKTLYKFSLRFTSEVWVLNSDDKDLLLEEKIVKAEKIFILPSEGVDVEKYKPIISKRDDNKIIFLMIARAFYDKGFGEYLKVAKILKEKYGSNIEFQFLGALEESQRSGIDKQKMEEIQKEGILTYLGITNDVPSIVKDCDCIVLPSYREGMSMVLLEGAAMEKPLIASDVTGCKEVIEDGKTGFLIKAKSVSSLLEGMEKFIRLTKKERVLLGVLGREKIMKEYQDDIVIKIYKDKVEKYGA